MLEVIPRRLTFISVIIPSREGVFTVACKGTHIPVCLKQTYPWKVAPVREILLNRRGFLFIVIHRKRLLCLAVRGKIAMYSRKNWEKGLMAPAGNHVLVAMERCSRFWTRSQTNTRLSR